MAEFMLRLKRIEEEFQLDHNVRRTSLALGTWAKIMTGVKLAFLSLNHQLLTQLFSLCEVLLSFQAKAPPSENDELVIRRVFTILSDTTLCQMNEQPKRIVLFRTMAELYNRENGRFAQGLSRSMVVMLRDDPTLAGQVDKIEGLMPEFHVKSDSVVPVKVLLFHLRAQEEGSRLTRLRQIVKFCSGRWELKDLLKNFFVAFYKDEICGQVLTELVKAEVERLTGVLKSGKRQEKDAAFWALIEFTERYMRNPRFCSAEDSDIWKEVCKSIILACRKEERLPSLHQSNTVLPFLIKLVVHPCLCQVALDHDLVGLVIRALSLGIFASDAEFQTKLEYIVLILLFCGECIPREGLKLLRDKLVSLVQQSTSFSTRLFRGYPKCTPTLIGLRTTIRCINMLLDPNGMQDSDRSKTIRSFGPRNSFKHVRSIIHELQSVVDDHRFGWFWAIVVEELQQNPTVLLDERERPTLFYESDSLLVKLASRMDLNRVMGQNEMTWLSMAIDGWVHVDDSPDAFMKALLSDPRLDGATKITSRQITYLDYAFSYFKRDPFNKHPFTLCRRWFQLINMMLDLGFESLSHQQVLERLINQQQLLSSDASLVKLLLRRTKVQLSTASFLELLKSKTPDNPLTIYLYHVSWWTTIMSSKGGVGRKSALKLFPVHIFRRLREFLPLFNHTNDVY